MDIPAAGQAPCTAGMSASKTDSVGAERGVKVEDATVGHVRRSSIAAGSPPHATPSGRGTGGEAASAARLPAEVGPGASA